MVFRKALRHHSIENRYDFYYLHNNGYRISVYCKYRCDCDWKEGRRVKCYCNSDSKCPFRVYATKVKLEETFQLKSMNLSHTCTLNSVNTKVAAEYLAERYIDEWRDDPKWSFKQFRGRVFRDLRVQIGYYKAYYAKLRALHMIHGSAKEE